MGLDDLVNTHECSKAVVGVEREVTLASPKQNKGPVCRMMKTSRFGPGMVIIILYNTSHSWYSTLGSIRTKIKIMSIMS